MKICIKCKRKKTPAVEGKTMCAYHLAKYNQYKKNWKAKKAKESLCIICGKKYKGSQLCKDCRDNHNVYNIRWSHNNVANGLCRQCSRPLASRTLCAIHLKIINELTKKYRRRYIKKGLCYSCGLPLDEFSKIRGVKACMNCTTKRAERIML